MGWILFLQIIILAMWFYLLAYALIDGYFKKKFDKDLELHDVTSANKSHKGYNKFG